MAIRSRQSAVTCQAKYEKMANYGHLSHAEIYIIKRIFFTFSEEKSFENVYDGRQRTDAGCLHILKAHTKLPKWFEMTWVRNDWKPIVGLQAYMRKSQPHQYTQTENPYFAFLAAKLCNHNLNFTLAGDSWL